MGKTERPAARAHGERFEELELLLDLTRAMSEADDLGDALLHVLARLGRATGWSHAAAWLAGSGGELEAGPAWRAEGADPAQLATTDPGFLARVCSERAVLWDDLEGTGAARVEPRSGRPAAVVGVPILAHRECVGVMLFHVPDRAARTPRAVVLVSVAAAQLGVWLKRKRAEDAVRASEERFRLLVEHVGDAVIMVDREDRIVTWTPVATRMLGYTAGEVLGRPAGLFDVGKAAEARAIALEEAASTGRHEVDGWHVRKDGTRLWAHVVTCPIRNPRGQITGFAKVVRDLTIVRAAEEAARRHAVELEASNRELEGFASIASHDLQEPLRKILAFGDRLRGHCGDTLGERGQGYLDRLQDAACRMQLLVDDLLAYARIASRNQRFALVELDVIATEVLRDLETRIEQAGARIEVGSLPSIEADPMQMRQLLQNLVANALKFHARGTPPVIRLSSRAVASGGEPAPARWELLVADEGIGFDEKYLDRIFGMLQRLHGRADYEGTGMGLAICRRIAERHRGEITARSAPGLGTTFIVTLPATQREPGGMP